MLVISGQQWVNATVFVADFVTLWQRLSHCHSIYRSNHIIRMEELGKYDFVTKVIAVQLCGWPQGYSLRLVLDQPMNYYNTKITEYCIFNLKNYKLHIACILFDRLKSVYKVRVLSSSNSGLTHIPTSEKLFKSLARWMAFRYAVAR